MKPPLQGVTGVAIEQAVAGPLATRQLADLGVRVIKIERPDGVRDRSEPDHFNLFAESDVLEEDLPKKSACSSMNSISTHS
jgi:crotonobetainyl-CoA:carnitine CoA-transferase CaiB-like acyl-CoA transferase